MYKLTINELIEICSVCDLRDATKQPCRRCKYDGEPCKQAKERLEKEALEKIHKGLAKPFEYSYFIDKYN